MPAPTDSPAGDRAPDARQIELSEETRIVELIVPALTNAYGTLFAGSGLSLMTKVAFLTATRSDRRRYMLVSANEIDWRRPVMCGQLCEIIGRVIDRGNRSVTVQVEMLAEDPDGDTARVCATGKFGLVALKHDPGPMEGNDE